MSSAPWPPVFKHLCVFMSTLEDLLRKQSSRKLPATRLGIKRNRPERQVPKIQPVATIDGFLQLKRFTRFWEVASIVILRFGPFLEPPLAHCHCKTPHWQTVHGLALWCDDVASNFFFYLPQQTREQSEKFKRTAHPWRGRVSCHPDSTLCSEQKQHFGFSPSPARILYGQGNSAHTFAANQETWPC